MINRRRLPRPANARPGDQVRSDVRGQSMGIGPTQHAAHGAGSGRRYRPQTWAFRYGPAPSQSYCGASKVTQYANSPSCARTCSTGSGAPIASIIPVNSICQGPSHSGSRTTVTRLPAGNAFVGHSSSREQPLTSSTASRSREVDESEEGETVTHLSFPAKQPHRHRLNAKLSTCFSTRSVEDAWRAAVGVRQENVTDSHADAGGGTKVRGGISRGRVSGRGRRCGGRAPLRGSVPCPAGRPAPRHPARARCRWGACRPLPRGRWRR